VAGEVRLTLNVENAFFFVTPCRTCPLPGYLIVGAKTRATSFADLDPETLRALGPTLSLAINAVEEVINPKRVYCALFGEENREIHFHIFPRTEWIEAAYPEKGPVDGPKLLSWARNTFKEPLPGRDPDAAFEKIAELIRAQW
jgi:diadenosine tetraphosphate (Ap4A) HIT family hydrolase